MAQPPSFPFYVGDYLTGTMSMKPAERGVYVDCLCYQWEVDGVPGDDPDRLAQVMRCSPADARKFWTVVRRKFERGDDGLYRNARLERERESKKKWHETRQANGAKGGRPPKHETSREPSGSENGNHMVPSSSPSPSEPTVQTETRAPAPDGPGRRTRPNPYAHAVVQAPNGRAFWEGPIFSIPHEWARKTLAAANGKAAGSTIVLFATALTERLQREGGEAPTKGFLGWLDTEWTAYRQPSAPSPYAPAEAVIAEMRAVSASIAAEAGTPESRRAIVREVLGRRPS